MVELQDQYEGQGLAVIGINAGEAAGAVRDFVEQSNLSYLNLLGDENVMGAYRVTAHPLTVLITPQGTIHEQYLGWREKQEFEQGVQGLIDLSQP